MAISICQTSLQETRKLSPTVDFKKLFKDTQELLDYAGLTDIYPKEIAHNLNSGQMAMVSLLRAYAKNPKVLVLDEPTGALTNNEVDILMRILNELRDKGVSCIYISHKMLMLHFHPPWRFCCVRISCVIIYCARNYII